nr:hypothetical protein [Tanacetum cinerariifolium]
MGRSRESFGTVQVVSRCTGVAVGKGVVLAGKLVRGYCVGRWGLGNWQFRSLGFVIVCKLVLELVPELWNFEKLSFIVVLFDENLLPDPAFL